VGKKKYQIFISSTYLDLQDERQAAVEAILGSKHIPAGMELFRAGNASQLDTIKKWIDESDLYMLILGGRYGSIEPKTGKSYTHLEYEYALEKEIPVFAVVLSESFLFTKAAEKSYEVFEKDNKEKYDEFKTYVMTKMIKEVDDCKDIKIAIKDSISDFESEGNLSGWVRASEIEDCALIVKENDRLLKEVNELREKVNNINMNSNVSKRNIDLDKYINVKYIYMNVSRDEIDGNLKIKVKDIISSLGYLYYQKSNINNEKFEWAIIKDYIDENIHDEYVRCNLESESITRLMIMLESHGLIDIYDDIEDSKTIELTDIGKCIVAEILLENDN
jgi:hypothetical protein